MGNKRVFVLAFGMAMAVGFALLLLAPNIGMAVSDAAVQAGNFMDSIVYNGFAGRVTTSYQIVGATLAAIGGGGILICLGSAMRHSTLTSVLGERR